MSLIKKRVVRKGGQKSNQTTETTRETTTKTMCVLIKPIERSDNN